MEKLEKDAETRGNDLSFVVGRLQKVGTLQESIAPTLLTCSDRNWKRYKAVEFNEG